MERKVEWDESTKFALGTVALVFIVGLSLLLGAIYQSLTSPMKLNLALESEVQAYEDKIKDSQSMSVTEYREMMGWTELQEKGEPEEFDFLFIVFLLTWLVPLSIPFIADRYLGEAKGVSNKELDSNESGTKAAKGLLQHAPLVQHRDKVVATEGSKEQVRKLTEEVHRTLDPISSLEEAKRLKELLEVIQAREVSYLPDGLARLLSFHLEVFVGAFLLSIKGRNPSQDEWNELSRGLSLIRSQVVKYMNQIETERKVGFKNKLRLIERLSIDS